MSSIPSSVMPHALAAEPEAESGRTLSERAADLAQFARDNPKTVIAAGAAAVAAGVAAAAFPLVRGRRSASKGGRKGAANKKKDA